MLSPSADAPLIIVVNTSSGHEDVATTLATIERVLGEVGRAHEVLLVPRGAQLPPIAQQAVARAQACGGVVVAAGGDGTLNAVAQTVLGSGCAFGVLPQGTFNYFSRSHGLPSDTAGALRALLAATAQPVQVGLVNDRVFLVNASLGLYPQLLEDREAYKRQYGRNRLVALGAALMTLLQAHRPLRLLLETRSGACKVRTPTLFVANNPLQLQQIGIAEAQALEQGELAAITLRPVGTLAMLWLMLRGAFGRLGEADDVSSFSFRCLTVRPAALGRARVKVATDGEVVWLRTPLEFCVSPQPLYLLKPATGALT
jgi:diacylglycerol kinase family enzyme